MKYATRIRSAVYLPKVGVGHFLSVATRNFRGSLGTFLGTSPLKQAQWDGVRRERQQGGKPPRASLHTRPSGF